MTIDELTDNAFFDLYDNNPKIKGIVDEIQMKYKAHKSQEGKPGYDPGNTAWYKEAKGTVAEIVAQQKKAGEHGQAEGKKNAAAGPEKPFPERLFGEMTPFKAAVGLAVLVIGVAVAPYLGAAAPLAAKYSAYTAPAYIT